MGIFPDHLNLYSKTNAENDDKTNNTTDRPISLLIIVSNIFDQAM